ncbi:Zn-ribbon domain-containing OB-fold protein [Polaromonas sp.]|uniref:Zn-ribbon domain-containing OB-fold protein n=1 Tax=Polaromonas sp. TaxID=1869339 RepID=UPI00352AC38A
MKESSVSTGPDAVYLKYLGEGTAHLQRCEECAEFFFPPRVLCPHCASTSYKWSPISGKGTIYSSTFVSPAKEDGPGHSVLIVQLEEGPRLLGTSPDVTAADGKIGEKVRAVIEPFQSGSRLSFRIDES